MARSISFDIGAVDKASKALEQVAREVTELEKKLDGAGGTIEVDADTGKAREQIAAVDAQLARLNAKSLKIDADIAGARRDLQVLEAEAKRATGDRKLKVDADITAAQARLRALEAAKVSVDVETGAAQAKLAAVEASLSKVDGDRATAKVDVDASGALGALAQIGGQLRAAQTPVTITIGVAGAMEALAWIQAVGAGLVGLGAAGIGAGGVTAAALSGIGDAVTELGKKTEATGGKVSSSGASMRSAIRAVEAAQRDLRSANEDVVRSEEDLSDAQDDARRAVEALDDARKDATRTLEDYALRSADMSLRQERASIGVAEAQQRLNEVNKDSKSTSLERAAAELAVREALQRQNELTVDAKRLTEDKSVADAKGVEQSDQVVAAQDRIKDANKRVEEAQRGIEKAHEQVALAAQRVSDAQLAVREASQAAGSAGSAAADKQREAFEKLTPEGQRFALFLRELIDGPLKELRDTAQAGVLPGLQSGIEGFMENLGDAQGRIASISKQTGDFFDEVGPAAGRAAQALLRLADLGAQASFDGLADGIVQLLDGFTAWANSQSAAEISADVRKVADDLKSLRDTGVRVFRGLQLAWEVITFSTDAFTGPAEAIEGIYRALRNFAETIPGLRGRLPELETGISDLRSATDGASTATDRLDGSSRRLAGTQRDLESATRLAKDEMLRGEEASLRYAETLGRTESAARANGQAWSLNTEQGRGNRQALLDLIRTSNDTITSLEGQGASVDTVRAKYESQRAKLIEVATQMTGSRARAQEYIDKLLQVPADKTTNVKANTAQAMAGIGAVATGLANLKDKTVSVLTRYTSITATGTATAGRSAGGWIPGAPSSVDTVPALLAQGEYVVRASSAQQWGPLLEVINGGGSPAAVSAALGPYAGGSTGVPAPRGQGGGGGTVVVQAPNMVVGQEDAVIRWVVAALGVAKDRGLLPPSFTVAAAG